jgi:glycine hydroxymethyltransferase
VIAAKAVALNEALSPQFKEYQGMVIKNAQKLAAELTGRGFKIISGGTDNHMMLVDLTSKNITGKETEEALGRARITVNKNVIPFDERPPTVTSGIRLGTPCVTTRGMGEPEMVEIADVLSSVIQNNKDTGTMNALTQRVDALCEKFPIY